ncbi:hypothetical protein QR98_0101170 [Sarcoptes scabiei]|nr:hypothetical protein QR98_0101170 [Sarcoptes scabiei]
MVSQSAVQHQHHQTAASSLFPTLALGQSSNPSTTANVMAVLANAARSPFKLVTSSQPLVNLSAIGAGNNHQSTTKTKEKKTKKNRVNSSNCQCCCDADKPYICDWVNCGKRFRQKPHLEAHRNIHTGRRFVCDWPNCGKSFVRKYNLVEHQKLHSAVNPNMCTYPDCGKVFSSKYSLMRHQNAQHNLNL